VWCSTKTTFYVYVSQRSQIQFQDEDHAVCTYCRDPFDGILEAAKHCAKSHPTENVSYMWEVNERGTTKYLNRTFKVKGRDIIGNIDNMTINKSTGKIIIPTKILASDSPIRKFLKINTPTKSVHCQLFSETIEPECAEDSDESTRASFKKETPLTVPELTEQLETTMLSSDSESENVEEMKSISEDVLTDSKTVKETVAKLQKLLPSVTSHLNDCKRLEEWVTFFEMVNTGVFTANHIAAQLFLDVVNFSKLTDVRRIRYTPEVKQFWAVGQSLFKTKFLRFMGGFKAFSRVQEHGELDCKDMKRSDISMLNFVCPSIDVLKEERKRYSIDCSDPGIIYSNLEAVASIASTETKSYNLCVDGKKIAPGLGKKLGDVNLFGHESEPTFATRKDRFEVEMQAVRDTSDDITKWIEQDINIIAELTTSKKSTLYDHVIDILSINTERIKELRRLKVSRQITLDKLLKIATEPWQTSKYSFAISSIKTHIYDINRCVTEMLELNTKLGLVAAACNGSESMYSLEGVIDLSDQANYVCLSSTTSQKACNQNISTEYIKQRTERWHHDRNKAKVTGSTLHQALGLSTLKKQQEHYDRVIVGKKTQSHDKTENIEAMQHGVVNEINAAGTLMARIMPIYAPDAKFHEEGYYKVNVMDHAEFMIVSPDGSLRFNDKVEYGVEIKCPVPNKKYATDVHYELPKYYITQILSEMAALKCEKLMFISWTPESTTLMKITFDADLWKRMETELLSVFGDVDGSSRPSRKRPIVSQLNKDIDKFREKNVSLLCEVASVVSIECQHLPIDSEDCLTHSHNKNDSVRQKKETEAKNTHLTTDSVLVTLCKEKSSLEEVYNILRIPAKEVLVAVLSDLDRHSGPTSVHGVPVAYGLAGYSLKLQCMRSLMEDIIYECHKKGILIKSLSTDGQFYRLCVRDKKDRPLTILQVARDTWEQARKMSKTEQISALINLNVAPDNNDICNNLDTQFNMCEESNRLVGKANAIHVNGWKNKPWPKLYNPRRMSELLSKHTKSRKSEENMNSIDLENMPVEAAETLLNEVSDDIVPTDDMYVSGLTTISNSQPDQDTRSSHIDEEVEMRMDWDEVDMTEQEEESLQQKSSSAQINLDKVPSETLCDIVSLLKEGDAKRKNPKWKSLNETKLKCMLKSEPSLVLKVFAKNELVTCATYFKGAVENVAKQQVEELTKLDLANAFSLLFGQSTQLARTRSPPKLRQLLKDLLSKRFNKEVLNAITATRMFLETSLPAWRQQSVFKDGIYLGDTDIPYVWYSQPEYFENVEHCIVYLLDCHHLLVNARAFICQHGISGLNVKKDAWISVAESESAKETGLNRAMVVDLVDRQSNAIAQIVFSEKVEKKMIELGWISEAHICKCLREWYKAEDESGLDVLTRYQYRMNMRQTLLEKVHFADFPPPGSHVLGMPIVMFEGILTNIDRRYQLHALVHGNAYNVRAPNTLAVENLFGCFQDLDPKSTGVLLADDIPHAIETASYLIQSRLDPNRYYALLYTS